MVVNIYFLNVGNGDAICINLKKKDKREDAWIVVDCGPNLTNKNEVTLSSFIDIMGIKKLTLLVITHLHEDHLGGIIDAANLIDEIEEFWGPSIPNVGKDVMLPTGSICEYFTKKTAEGLNTYNYFLNYLLPKLCKKRVVGKDVRNNLTWSRDGSTLTVIHSGFGLSWIEGFLRKIYQAELNEHKLLDMEAISEFNKRLNETSLVLKFQSGCRSILLTGDAPNGWWNLHNMSDIGSDILKLSHHGNLDGNNQELIDIVNPQLAICSARDFQSNLPHPEIKSYLSEKSISLLKTGGTKQHGIKITWTRNNVINWEYFNNLT